MKKITYENITTIYLVAFIMTLFINSIIYVYELTNGDYISFSITILGGVGLILYLYYVIKNKTIRFWDLLVILIYFFCYLSYLHAFNQEAALYGYYSGREGLLVIYVYYIIFLLSSTLQEAKNKHLIISLLTCECLIQVLYGLLQVSGLYFIFKFPIVNPGKYSSGFFYNSNFFGTYTTLIIGLWLPTYFFSQKDKFSIKYYLLLSFLIIGLLSCGTMSALVALIMMLFLSIIYYLIKKKKHSFKVFAFKLLLIILTIFIESFALTKITNSSLDKDTKQLKNEIVGVMSGKVEDSFGTGRIYIWKQTIKYIPKYFWFGIGIDNFTYLGFESGTFIYDSPLEDNIINKAHNEYLNIFATGGIFLIVVYLVLIISVFIQSSKSIIKDRKENHLRNSFFFAFCGYLVQAFFNVRITLNAPLFFMITGLLVSQDKEKNKNS